MLLKADQQQQIVTTQLLCLCAWQAVRRLDAQIAELKTAAALSEQTAWKRADNVLTAHEQEVAALKAANSKLQLELTDLAQAVPAMLR